MIPKKIIWKWNSWISSYKGKDRIWNPNISVQENLVKTIVTFEILCSTESYRPISFKGLRIVEMWEAEFKKHQSKGITQISKNHIKVIKGKKRCVKDFFKSKLNTVWTIKNAANAKTANET